MGGPSKQETQQTQSSTPTIGGSLLNSVLGNAQNLNPNLTGAETTALDTLSTNAQAGNPFASQIGNVANTLLAGGGPDRTGMVNDAYAQYRAAMDPTARGDFLDPNKNPFFGTTTSGLTDAAVTASKNLFAGSGRDPSGAGSLPGVIGREITKAVAPVYANAYSTERDRQLAAINGLYGAGNTTAGTLSGLDQTRLGNQQAGIGAADAAIAARDQPQMQQLAIEAQRRGIPLQTLAAQFGFAMPAAQAFATQTGNSTTTKQMSPLEQFYMATSGVKNLFGSAPTPK